MRLWSRGRRIIYEPTSNSFSTTSLEAGLDADLILADHGAQTRLRILKKPGQVVRLAHTACTLVCKSASFLHLRFTVRAQLFERTMEFQGHTPEWVQQHPLSAEYRGILVPIEAAQEIDEIDSAYGSDLETKVVNPSRSLSYEENGRTYHTFGRTKYWGPNDKRACELLELGHKIWKLVLPGLYAAPLEGNSSSFLDLGTGTGTWAIDVAKKYKGSEVVGIDVSDIQPRAVPQNVEFFLDDFNLENYEERARYDMIRGRDLYGSVLNWPRLIGKCFKALKPGGWLECAGSSLPIPADTLEESRVLLQWKQTFVDAGEKNGMTFDVRSKLEWWLEAAGFVEVEVKKITVPVGGRSKLGKMSLKRLDRGLFDFSGRLLSEVLGWSLARITVFLAAVRKELRKNKARVIHYQEFYIVYGRKPLEG